MAAGQELMVTVTVAGPAGTDDSGTTGAAEETTGTTGTADVVGTGAVVWGTVMVVSLPMGQLVTVGWQLVMVLTMVV